MVLGVTKICWRVSGNNPNLKSLIFLGLYVRSIRKGYDNGMTDSETQKFNGGQIAA